MREGVVSIHTASPSSPSTPSTPTDPYSLTASSSSSRKGTRTPTRPAPIPFSALSVSFSTRRVGLVLTVAASRRKRTIVEVPRGRDDRLESTAKKLVKELAVWLYSGSSL
jgi:hypothetical protein